MLCHEFCLLFSLQMPKQDCCSRVEELSILDKNLASEAKLSCLTFSCVLKLI